MDILQIHDMFAHRQAILTQKISLIKILHELTIDLTGNRNIIIEPCFGGQKVVQKFFVVHVFVEVDRLLDEIADRTEQ